MRAIMRHPNLKTFLYIVYFKKGFKQNNIIVEKFYYSQKAYHTFYPFNGNSDNIIE